MPKQVKLPKGREFAFKTASKGGESKYDWDGWLKGDLLLIEQSGGSLDPKGNIIEVTQKRDYEVTTDMMVPKLKFAARRRHKVVQISRLDADGNKLQNALIIRARDMTAEERLAEDTRRAEEKVANIDRRASKKEEVEDGEPTASIDMVA